MPLDKKESTFPNVSHHNNWRITISNIPNVDVSEMKFFDNYVKSFVLPDYNVGLFTSNVLGYTIRHPESPDANEDLSTFQMDFKMSEEFYNYLSLFQWMQEIRYGQINSDNLLRKYYVKKITLELLDNQKRNIANIYFTNCFLVSLSSVALNFGSADEILFTSNWSYEEVLFERKNIKL